ncbi:MAG: hypothetical protein AAGD07_15830 [Planctomycetota bacterium]
MRTLLLLGLAIGGAFMAGWFTIERDGDRTRIEINKSEIRSDTRQAIDKGRDYLDQREQQRLQQAQMQTGQPVGSDGSFINLPWQQNPGSQGYNPASADYGQASGAYGQPPAQYGQPAPQYGQPMPPYGQPPVQSAGYNAPNYTGQQSYNLPAGDPYRAQRPGYDQGQSHGSPWSEAQATPPWQNR